MLQKIELSNYRCFEKHTIIFRQEAVLVGKNNAGKSTIIEAIRLVSIVAARYQSITYKNAPEWLDLPPSTKGIFPDLDGIEFNFQTVRHRYNETVPTIKAIFSEGEQIVIYIGDREIFVVLTGKNGTPVRTKAEALRIKIPDLRILPQLGPLLKKEYIRSSRYVVQSMSSHLASLHFRNQLRIFSEEFTNFCDLSSNTWPGLEIRGLEYRTLNEGNQKEQIQLLLEVRDGDFVAEISEMGHGLQIWLQIIWFLSLVEKDSIIVLDEPDVYMHAELQRKLIRFLRDKYNQILIATHSVEIISDVEPKSIVVINKTSEVSKYIDSAPVVQRLIDNLGTVHNIQLAKLSTAKKCLFVEGEDLKVLSILHNKLFPKDLVALEAIPNMVVEGRNNWHYAIGSTILNNHLGETIKVYCIIDRDYHSETDIQKQFNRAEKYGVELHVWERKEIENYLLVPGAIHRIILEEIEDKKAPPSVKEIESQLIKIIDSQYEIVFDAMAADIFESNRSKGFAYANKTARSYLTQVWQTQEGKLIVVSGKAVINNMKAWVQQNYKVSFSAMRIARELKAIEISHEVFSVLAAISMQAPFKNQLTT